MAETETAKAEKEGKAIFEGGTKNEEGKHTEAPADFDFGKFKPIKKTDFLSDDIYLDHQENICRAKVDIFTCKADKCARDAAKLRTLGDPATRKKAMKLSKMRESLKELERQLVEDGVDMSLLNEE